MCAACLRFSDLFQWFLELAGVVLVSFSQRAGRESERKAGRNEGREDVRNEHSWSIKVAVKNVKHMAPYRETLEN